MPFNKPPKTQEEYLIRRIDDLERRFDAFKNRHRPTVPIYDYTAPPNDAVEGQIAVMLNAPPISAGGGLIGDSKVAQLNGSDTTIAANTLTALAFVPDSSYTWIDFTDPVNIVLLEAGTYAMTFNGLCTTGSIPFYMELNYAFDGIYSTAVFPDIRGSVSLTLPLPANSTISVGIQNRSGASHTFRIQQFILTKIATNSSAIAVSPEIPWALAERQSSVSIASNSTPTYTTFDLDHFYTNDPTSFIQATSGGQNGISVARPGLYKVTSYINLTLASATSPETKRAKFGDAGGGTFSRSFWFPARQDVYGVQRFGTTTGVWEIWGQELHNYATGSGTYPQTRYTLRAAHEAGGSTSSFAGILMERIGNEIPGGLAG